MDIGVSISDSLIQRDEEIQKSGNLKDWEIKKVKRLTIHYHHQLTEKSNNF